jgi:cytochrome c oxidase cbb3-type subunit 3
VLSPKPRDFTAGGLDAAAVLRALSGGRPGTAMQDFRSVLTPAEMEAVAAFVVDEFVTRKAPNTAYHTAANGWPDHRRRYGAAYPYVLGQASVEAAQTAGSRLYLSACITCHQPDAAAPTWNRAPR